MQHFQKRIEFGNLLKFNGNNSITLKVPYHWEMSDINLLFSDKILFDKVYFSNFKKEEECRVLYQGRWKKIGVKK